MKVDTEKNRNNIGIQGHSIVAKAASSRKAVVSKARRERHRKKSIQAQHCIKRPKNKKSNTRVKQKKSKHQHGESIAAKKQIGIGWVFFRRFEPDSIGLDRGDSSVSRLLAEEGGGYHCMCMCGWLCWSSVLAAFTAC